MNRKLLDKVAAVAIATVTFLAAAMVRFEVAEFAPRVDLPTLLTAMRSLDVLALLITILASLVACSALLR